MGGWCERAGRRGLKQNSMIRDPAMTRACVDPEPDVWVVARLSH